MRSQSQGWKRSVDRSTCRRGIEPRHVKKIRVLTSSMMAEGNTGGCENASIHRTLRGQRPRMYGTSTRENREALPTPDTKLGAGPVGEGDEPQVQHERWWRVARSCSTCEVPEQRRRAVDGGCGGKTTGQGEHGADDRVPNSELGRRVERVAPCAGSSKEG